MKQLRMRNGQVIDANDIDAVREDETDEWHEFDGEHRLADALPAEQPANAPRDDNDDPVFDDA